MSISNTIVVNTVVQDKAVSVASFGVPLILAYTTAIPQGAGKSYACSTAGLTELVADGFSVTSDVYRKATAMLLQEVHPTTFKVFPRAAGNAQTLEFTPINVTEGYKYSFTVDCDTAETLIEYTNGAAETPTTIATALQALLDALAGVTAVDNTGSVEIDPDDLEERIYLKGLPSSSVMTVEDTSTDAGAAADFASALVADPSFYGLLTDSTSPAEISLFAVAAAAASKIYGADSLDSDNFVADDGVAYSIAQTTNNYCYVRPSRENDGQFATGIMALQFAKAPGSSNWANKAAAGAVADALLQGELDNARANGAMIYTYEDGQSFTLDGASCGGRYLDIVRGIDWLDATIHAGQRTVLLTNEKIPYTDPGAALFEVALRQALQAGENAGLLAPGWTVTRGKVSDQSQADKAARRFPALSWDAVLAGAINEVNPLEGTVTL